MRWRRKAKASQAPPHCWFCLLITDAEKQTFPLPLCDECRQGMEDGAVLVCVQDGEMDRMMSHPIKIGRGRKTVTLYNPKRDPLLHVAYVSREEVSTMFPPGILRNRLLDVKWSFIDKSDWVRFGLEYVDGGVT